jgi:hypothetical protein
VEIAAFLLTAKYYTERGGNASRRLAWEEADDWSVVEPCAGRSWGLRISSGNLVVRGEMVRGTKRSVMSGYGIRKAEKH